MSQLNSKIIICDGIKMDRDYNNVLNYSEQEMINLINEHAVANNSHYSFVRGSRTSILTNFSYSQCLHCNYLAYQNTEYSNKWFFAFIDSIEYKSDGCTQINFTIDVWSTWFNMITPQACFVVREHVNNDTPGLHTVPENIETGPFISCKLQPTISDNLETCFVLGVTELLTSSYSTLNQLLPSGIMYIGLTTLQGVRDYCKKYDEAGKGDAINSVFVIPKEFFSGWGITEGINGQTSYTVKFNISKDLTVNTVNYLGNDYVPKNKKLLTYPYSFLQVSNHNGIVVNYEWENFNLLDVGTTGINFKLDGTITPGGSFNLHPVNYKNMLNNYDDSISLGKFPIGGWNNDAYTNWMTQNSVNIGMSLATNTLTLATNIATENVGGAISSGLSIANTVASIRQHALVPDQARGNVNVGDYSFAFGLTNIEFKRMSVKNEYAKIIDDFFTRRGYKINELKVPNITGRPYYNYIEIANTEDIGSGNIPNNYSEEINNICRRGVTIWHSHSNLGNYSLDNSLH